MPRQSVPYSVRAAASFSRYLGIQQGPSGCRMLLERGYVEPALPYYFKGPDGSTQLSRSCEDWLIRGSCSSPDLVAIDSCKGAGRRVNHNVHRTVSNHLHNRTLSLSRL